jgi:hypothetical protein
MQRTGWCHTHSPPPRQLLNGQLTGLQVPRRRDGTLVVWFKRASVASKSTWLLGIASTPGMRTHPDVEVMLNSLP